MKPRIFISSTFYDLKYIREDLANFIRTYNYEPILFEEGDIGYESGKPLDNSCYDAMRTSDMALLIIGGQHGTNATNQTDENVDNFISITQQEFISAVQNHIPVYAFVDSKVYTEYDIYKENIDKIKKDYEHITFRITKDIRVFDFIQNIYSLGSIPINEFCKLQDIKDFLSKQWSDMFKKYLIQCKENREIETIKFSVSKLESIVNQMSIMMDAIGKNILEKNDEYNAVKNKQKIQEFFAEFNKSAYIDPTFTNKDESFAERFISAIIEACEFFDKINFEGNKVIFEKGFFKEIEPLINPTIHKIFFNKYEINLWGEPTLITTLLNFYNYILNFEIQEEIKEFLREDIENKLRFVLPCD